MEGGDLSGKLQSSRLKTTAFTWKDRYVCNGQRTTDNSHGVALKPQRQGARETGIGKGQEARGKRQEARGKRHEARGKRQEARGTRQEARGKRQEARGKRQEARGKRQEARREDKKKQATKTRCKRNWHNQKDRRQGQETYKDQETPDTRRETKDMTKTKAEA
jgi:hypothetical protein